MDLVDSLDVLYLHAGSGPRAEQCAFLAERQPPMQALPFQVNACLEDLVPDKSFVHRLCSFSFSCSQALACTTMLQSWNRGLYKCANYFEVPR